MYKTGHSPIKEKMKELDSPLSGEMSGHVCYADDFYGYDDAMSRSDEIKEFLRLK